MADLKRVYTAPSEETALSELEQFDAVLGKKYLKIAISWRKHWAELSTFFKYPKEVRKLIYTTNAIERFNRQLRKVTKKKAYSPLMTACLRCCIWPLSTSPKNGRAGAKTGGKYILNSGYTSRSAYPNKLYLAVLANPGRAAPVPS
jgi:transposase-like protein